MPTTPGAPTITSVFTAGGDAYINFTAGASTDHISIEHDEDGTTSFFNVRFVRGFCGPPGCTTLGSSPAQDAESWRGVRVNNYRAQGWHNEGGGVFTPGPYSNIVGLAVPVAGSYVGGVPVTIEGDHLDYPRAIPNFVHFALGRPDPIIVRDALALPIRGTGPPGIAAGRFPQVSVPMFVKTEAAWHTLDVALGVSGAPVIVKTCFGSDPADQFFGQVLDAVVTPLTTADNQNKVFRRLVVNFQTIARPSDP